MKVTVGLLGIVVLLAATCTPAYAHATRTVTGSGKGSLVCSGSTVNDAITFSATSAGGTITGSYDITFGAAFNFGTITGGHINHHNYRLDGQQSVSFGCGFDQSPTLIKGSCGTGVTIIFEVNGIVVGTYAGDVICT